MNSFNSKIILALILLLVLIATGSFLIKKKTASVSITTPAVQGSIATTSATAQEGWQTYTNDKYGFEFQYPPAWIVLPQEQNYDGVLFVALRSSSKNNCPDCGPDYYIEVDQSTGKTIDEWFAGEFQDRVDLPPKKTPVTINGNSALIISDPVTEGGCSGDYIVIKHDQYLFKMPNSDCSADKQIQQVNNSFKFINTNKSK